MVISNNRILKHKYTISTMAKEKLVLTDKTNPDLLSDLAGKEHEYQQMKFDHAVRGLGNPMELRQLRRDIARINTEMRQREMAELSADELAMRSKLRERRRKQR